MLAWACVHAWPARDLFETRLLVASSVPTYSSSPSALMHRHQGRKITSVASEVTRRTAPTALVGAESSQGYRGRCATTASPVDSHPVGASNAALPWP